MKMPKQVARWFGRSGAEHRDAGHRDAGHRIVIGGSLCLALFFAFLGSRALQEREALWQLQISKQAEIQRMALNSTQHGLQERTQLLAETIAADAWVTELVRQAHALPASDLEGLASIRNQLYTRLAPRWRNLQAHQPFRLYVHLAPSVKVLLRVHEPEHFGDLQIGWRPMVLEALRSGTSQAGLGLTRGSIGMRAIAPLLAEGADGPLQVGAIEVAMGVLEDLAQLDREFGSGVALLLREDLLLGSGSGEELRGLASDTRRWQLVEHSRPQVLAWQREQRLPAPEEGDSVRLLDDGERHYLVNQVALSSYQQGQEQSSEPLAVALIWHDISDQYNVHRRDKRWLVIKWLLAWCGAEALLLGLLRSTRRSTQRLMQRQQAALRALNEIAALPSLSRTEQLRQALRLGAEHFGMPLGIISRIEGEQYQVLVQVSPTGALSDGQQFELGNTYCSLALQQDEPLAITHMAESAHRRHPCYRHFALESYIGITVRVAGKPFGTLAFANSRPRRRPFDAADRDFLGLFARWVGAMLERQQQERAVRSARAYLQAVLDSATGVSIIATDTSGTISLFNSGAERLLGYSAAEMVGQCTPAIIHLEEEVQARAAELSEVAGQPVEGFEVFVHNARGGEPETRQWTYRHKDGSLRQINLTVSAMFDEGGQITGFLGIASDISELLQTTRALQKSESRFRGLVANLPGVVYRCANDADWSMRYVSEEIVNLCGYPASDFIDNRVRSFSSVVHPDDLAITYRAGEAIARQESFELTYRLRHAEGHDVWVREKGRGEYDSRGRLLWVDGFIWDVSERQAIENELRLSQQRFLSAFNTAPQGMALIGPDGRWLEVNDELCRMLGYSREELQALTFQQITHPDDLEADQHNLENLLAGRINAYQMEKRYLDKQGRTLWVLLSVSLVRDGHGQPVHFVSQIQDFSDRVVAERAVREREHYLSTLLDNVVDAIVTIDEQGHIETFNHAAEAIFGYQQQQVAGRNVRMLMPEPYSSAHDGYIQRYLRTGEAWVVGQVRELEGLRQSGERFAMELAVSQISHQGQRRFIAVIRDIAERKRIERMKNEFVSTVSHELRTPLTAIAGSLGLINGGALGEVPQAMRQMLAIAHSNSQRLSALINDLLDMDKLVAGKMHFDLQPRTLQPLLELALLHNQPYAEQHQVGLHLQAEGDAAVRVDAQRLAQVMANLLSNAAKFSPAGGSVVVRLQHRGEVLRVSVADSGPGIPEAFKSRIFSKFSQADSGDTRQQGGTGLGLAICKEIIERMGGHIGFDSSPGQGATFWFELPITGSAS
ncbi:MAG: PAS domain S-box protein [Pseudomonas sp.]|uniref:PAS domain S-box protein n=1 Tax=Ectopseudomonas guguanensis TaxID=1198456 RepID=UPI0012D4D3A0|nr:PAS domain S-box protein [Pseudomonas guguanensis]MPT21316.1 PAS domain S-box protein [Pseudomonas sp.]WJH59211.1 PAS domain S-box protein [Pseudomonas guguanensis]